MPDARFSHPRVASIYDAFDGERGDLTAYLDIADELGAVRVLDFGCGTGSGAAGGAAADEADRVAGGVEHDHQVRVVRVLVFRDASPAAA